jgi:exopolysaccharide production protein ExoQ
LQYLGYSSGSDQRTFWNFQKTMNRNFTQNNASNLSSTSQTAWERLDLFVFYAFCLYLTHLVFSPIDGQVALENLDLRATPAYLISTATFFPVASLYILSNWQVAIRSIDQFKGIIGLIFFFALCSSVWSVDIAKTAKSLIDLFFLLLLPQLICNRLGHEKTLRHIGYFLTGVTTASFCISVIGSPYGLMGGYHEGLWRGLFVHKNHFGVFLLMSMIFVMYAPVTCFPNYKLRIFCGLLGAVSIFMCGSATLLIAIAASVVFTESVRLVLRFRLGLFSRLVLFVLLVGAGALLWSEAVSYGAAIVDRDASFTGRTALWNVAWKFISASPLLGYGYGTAGGVETLDAVRRESGWLIAPSMHNGLITLALDLGLIITVLWVTWLTKLLLVFAGYSEVETSLKRLLAAVIVGFAFNSMADSSASLYLNISSALIFFVVVALREVSLTVESRNFKAQFS